MKNTKHILLILTAVFLLSGILTLNIYLIGIAEILAITILVKGIIKYLTN